jgi:hypothetical protein
MQIFNEMRKNGAKRKSQELHKNITTGMSFSMKCFEMKHVNLSLEKIMKMGSVRVDLSS